MEEEGDVKFWKVLVKPGGPPLFGTWNKIPFFGLPGNPVSSQVIFLSIVSPWISSSCNYHENQGPNIYQKVRVKLLNSAVGTKHKITMRRINIYFQDDILVAEVPTNQGSGNLRSLVDCNGLTLLQPGTNGNVGDVVDALWLK
jgi:molybdopterin molybdotransferase